MVIIDKAEIFPYYYFFAVFYSLLINKKLFNALVSRHKDIARFLDCLDVVHIRFNVVFELGMEALHRNSLNLVFKRNNEGILQETSINNRQFQIYAFYYRESFV